MPKPLIDIMTREQRHAFVRLQYAAGVLADPDATPRERRSHLVSFYRAYRELARVTPSRNLRASLDGLTAFMDNLYGPTTD